MDIAEFPPSPAAVPLMAARRVIFSLLLIPLLLALPATTSLAQERSPYRSLHNRETGMRFDYPTGWKFWVDKHNSLFIRGPRETPAHYAIMVIQPRPNTMDASGELDSMIRRISRQKGFRIISQGSETLKAGKAPFFVMAYSSPIEGKPVTWNHIHTALAHGGSVYLISYRAPERTFKRYKKHFDHLMLSLAFQPPSSTAKRGHDKAKRRPPAPPRRFVIRNGWIHDTVSGYRFRLPRKWKYKVNDEVVYAFSRSGGAGMFALGGILDERIDTEAWADAAEKALSSRLPFLEKRLLRSRFKYLGYVPEGMEYTVRDYEGRVNRVPVKGHVLYATYGLRVYVAGVFLSKKMRRGRREVEDLLNDFETTVQSLREASLPSTGKPTASGTQSEGKEPASIGARENGK